MEEQVVVCSARRQFATDGALSLADLAGIPWVAYPAGSSGGPFTDMVMQLLLEARLKSGIAYEIETITIDSLTAQKRIIEADFAIGMLPISGIQVELQLGSLRVLDVPDLAATVPVVMLQRRDGFLSNAAQALRELLATG